MKVLVINCGSSSVKFELFDMKDELSIANGIVEKIGTSTAILRYRATGRNELKEVLEILDHDQALELVLGTLMHPQYGVIEDETHIVGVGHRLVHGGERFSGSVLITDEVVRGITECSEFAPLHNPPNLNGIQISKKLLPHAIQAGVFDTAFHHGMPQRAYIYGLPHSLYKKLGIRRYGFHGSSHFHVSQRAAEILDEPIENLKIITTHLGNGASMAAVAGGSSIDTTMGFTPLEGLVMGTRCGDIDPALITYIMEKERLDIKEISDLLNKYSGLKGICETTNDMREILEEAALGSEHHILALEVFCYRVKKYIGAYAAAMGGVDVLVFTGGIGENAPAVREKILENMQFLGIELDPEMNLKNSEIISRGAVRVMVIPTNEELVIARETVKILEWINKREMEDEILVLSKEEKAELVLIWARNAKASTEEMARILSRRIGKDVDRDIIKKELHLLGLGAR
jgi:acetate kinase